ncbi:unnamed protein product [Moneuplotes crassus]|uniref:Uncharacterized protein n=1 Tax=Euplotes crassus TaxID=5936 RepID=A0AAD1XF86_EUPCR|nr:unnamed protein product [Moneuplotes crassus]
MLSSFSRRPICLIFNGITKTCSLQQRLKLSSRIINFKPLRTPFLSLHSNISMNYFSTNIHEGLKDFIEFEEARAAPHEFYRDFVVNRKKDYLTLSAEESVLKNKNVQHLIKDMVESESLSEFLEIIDTAPSELLYSLILEEIHQHPQSNNLLRFLKNGKKGKIGPSDKDLLTKLFVLPDKTSKNPCFKVEKQIIELWGLTKDDITYKNFNIEVGVFIKNTVENIDSIQELIQFKKILSFSKYFEIYTWDAGFKKLKQLFNDSQHDLSFDERYLLLDIWCRFINEVKHPSFFKHYNEVANMIFLQLFQKLSTSNTTSENILQGYSQAHFDSYIKLSPPSLWEIVQCFSNHYPIILELCNQSGAIDDFDIFVNQIIDLSKLQSKNLPDFAEWMHKVPPEICKHVDPQLLINKVTYKRKKNGIEYLEINQQLGNANLQKLVVVLDKFLQYYMKSDVEYNDYYKGIGLSNFPGDKDTDVFKENLTYSEVLQDAFKFCLHKKKEILSKNKGSLRMKCDELISFESLIFQILRDQHLNREKNNSKTKEYTEIFPLFCDNFTTHYDSYRINEDVDGIIKFIYCSPSMNLREARRKLATQVLPRNMNFINSLFVKRTIRSQDLEMSNVSSEHLLASQYNTRNELTFDENQMFNLIQNIYFSVPDQGNQRERVLGILEDKLTNKFEFLPIELIIKILQKITHYEENVSYDTLESIEKQFTKGKITSLYPNQIAELFKVYAKSIWEIPMLWNFLVTFFNTSLEKGKFELYPEDLADIIIILAKKDEIPNEKILTLAKIGLNIHFDDLDKILDNTIKMIQQKKRRHLILSPEDVTVIGHIIHKMKTINTKKAISLIDHQNSNLETEYQNDSSSPKMRETVKTNKIKRIIQGYLTKFRWVEDEFGYDEAHKIKQNLSNINNQLKKTNVRKRPRRRQSSRRRRN